RDLTSVPAASRGAEVAARPDLHPSGRGAAVSRADGNRATDSDEGRSAVRDGGAATVSDGGRRPGGDGGGSLVAAVLVSLPDGDEGERPAIVSQTVRARDDLARALGMPPPPLVTLRFHPTTDDYERV